MGCVTVRQASVQAAGPDTVVIVRLEAPSGRATLVLDPEWVDLALAARAVDPGLLEDLAVPPEAVLDFYPGWI